MKTEIGKIIIGKKVYFEYCNNNLCKNYNTLFRRCKYFNGYCDEKEAYEVSKRLIEVSNDYIVSPLPGTAHLWIQDTSRLRFLIKDGQKCKAEVNGTAKIVELIK